MLIQYYSLTIKKNSKKKQQRVRSTDNKLGYNTEILH